MKYVRIQGKSCDTTQGMSSILMFTSCCSGALKSIITQCLRAVIAAMLKFLAPDVRQNRSCFFLM